MFDETEFKKVLKRELNLDDSKETDLLLGSITLAAQGALKQNPVNFDKKPPKTLKRSKEFYTDPELRERVKKIMESDVPQLVKADSLVLYYLPIMEFLKGSHAAVLARILNSYNKGITQVAMKKEIGSVKNNLSSICNQLYKAGLVQCRKEWKLVYWSVSDVAWQFVNATRWDRRFRFWLEKYRDDPEIVSNFIKSIEKI